MTDLNAIRARLGSISPSAMSKLPKAVQTLLREDVPRLVEVAEAASNVWDNSEFYEDENGRYDSVDGTFMLALGDAIEMIVPPSPEQQIKDMPW